MKSYYSYWESVDAIEAGSQRTVVDRLHEGTSPEHIQLGSHQSVGDVIPRVWSTFLCSVRLVLFVGTSLYMSFTSGDINI